MSLGQIRSAMIATANELVARLTLVIMLEQDIPLQTYLRTLAGAQPGTAFAIQLPASEAWLLVGSGARSSLHRSPLPGVPEVRLDDKDGPATPLWNEFEQAHQRTKAYPTARNLLSPLFDAATQPTRSQIRTLMRWGPLLEHLAYKHIALTTQFLDELRPSIVGAQRPPSAVQSARLAEYWNAANTMAHLNLIACTPGARGWLVDMANAFEWVQWTPTFPLLRERTLWLAASAARSAVAFGAPVVDKYLACLSLATHPMKTFDAIFGLSAIGHSDPSVRDPVIGALLDQRTKLQRRDMAHASLTNELIDIAVRTLREPTKTFGDFTLVFNLPEDWKPSRKTGLTTLAAASGDPTDVLAPGLCIGLTALPVLVSMPPESYYPERPVAGQSMVLAPAQLQKLIDRAWGGTSARAPDAVVH